MNDKLKEIDMKNRTYYLFGDMITTKNLDPNKIRSYTKMFLFTIFDT